MICVHVCAYSCGLCVETVCVCMPHFFSTHTSISKLFLPCRIRPHPSLYPSSFHPTSTHDKPATSILFFLFVCFSSFSYLYLKIYFWMRFALLNFIPTPTFFVEPIFFFQTNPPECNYSNACFYFYFFVFRHFFPHPFLLFLYSRVMK